VRRGEAVGDVSIVYPAAAALSKYSFSDISAMPCRLSAPDEPRRACRLGFLGKAGRMGSSLPVVDALVVLMSISREEADVTGCSRSLGVITLLDSGRGREACRGVEGFCRGVVGVRNRGVLGLNRGVVSLKDPEGSLRGPVLVLGDGGTVDEGTEVSEGPEAA